MNRYLWNYRNSPMHLPIDKRILIARNVTDEKDQELFLNPSYEKHLHSAYLLTDMSKAVTRCLTAIQQKEKMLVFGDYDADGVTSTALLYSFLKQVNALVEYHIPHRINDGYGITVEGVDKVFQSGTKLIITVDNGISANTAIDRANELGMDVIITDHHKQHGDLPKALAIVNPNRRDCDYPFKGISGAGVTYKFIQALSDKLMSLKEREHFLKWSLDLVSLGTVADVMPLLNENRIFVHFGLKVLEKSKRIGLKILMESLLKQKKEADAHLIGFQIGPRLNAAGRLEAADLALELLLTNDELRSSEIINELNTINEKRQVMTEQALQEAVSMIDHHQKIIILSSDKWHMGIIGLIAARICENYNKPVMIFYHDKQAKTMKASGRSPSFFDISRFLMNSEELLLNGGGHKQACGCSIKDENYFKLKSILEEEAIRFFSQENINPKADLYIDSEIQDREINLETYERIQKLAPFGQEFTEPILKVNAMTVQFFKKVGFQGRHLHLILEKNGKTYKGICFRAGEWADVLQKGQIIDIAGSLMKNSWNGQSQIELNIHDLIATVLK